MRDLLPLPKGHLHLHLEGGMRPATLAELAERDGIPVPPVSGFGSFAAFAGMYLAACDVLRSDDDLSRLVHEVVDDAAMAGAVWIEPAFYAPHHLDRLGPVEHVLEVVLDALADAATRTGVGTGLLVAADRTAGAADAMAQAQLAARYADQGVVAFGLANDESLWPPEPFADAFRVARDAGLVSAPHAGELAGPESVVGALDALGASRIQHGVRAVEDPELVKRLADERICLDVCPTSNVLLSVVPSIDRHPLPALLEAGVRCSLNADDPLLFGPGLLEEYELAREQLGLDDSQLASIARSSIEASGADDDLRATALAGVDAWLDIR
ncbi:MAG: adenosine deaminase, partial [Acidimicrobiales bacterium]